MSYVRWHNFLEPQLPIFSIFAIFYVYSLIMLITSKQKLVRGSYFFIFLYTGVVDLLLFFADQYWRARGRLGLGPEFNGMTVLASTMTGILYSLHIFGNLLGTFCQYVAVCWHKYYERIWTVKWTLFYLTIITISGTIPYVPQFRMRIEYTLRNDTSYSAKTVEADVTGIIFTGLLVVSYIVLATFFVWRTFVSLKVLGVASKQLKRHYQSLAVITIVDCLFFLIDLVYEMNNIFWFLFHLDPYPMWLKVLLGDPFDVYYSTVYISNPIILVIFSRIARREVFRFCLKSEVSMENTKQMPKKGPDSMMSKASSNVTK